jgi:hypothetical protein
VTRCVPGVALFTWVLCALLPYPAFAESSSRSKKQEIVGGAPSSREGVVYVATNLDSDPTSDDRSCTGALVAPSLVMTARHCVSAFTEGTFSCSIKGNIDEERTRDPAGAGSVGLPYEPDWIRVYVGPIGPLNIDKSSPDALKVKRIFTVETDSICRNDLALVQLVAPLDIRPLALRLENGVRPRESTILVGFGLNDSNDSAQHELGGVRILAVGPSEFFPLEGQAPPRTFSVGEGPCPGDSGGPALSLETEAVLGVFSFFKGKCDSSTVYNYYTEVGPFAQFVRDVFQEVGEELTVEDGGVGGSPAQGMAGSPQLGGQSEGGFGGGSGETRPISPDSTGCSLGGSRIVVRAELAPWGGLIAAALGRCMRRRRDDSRRG